MFAFEDKGIKKPALIYAKSLGENEKGNSFYVEIYAMTANDFSKFIQQISSPLSIGKLKLENGENILGFVGDTQILDSAQFKNALDISEFGDWRKFKK